MTTNNDEFDNLAARTGLEKASVQPPSVHEQELTVAEVQMRHLEELRASPFSTYDHLLRQMGVDDSQPKIHIVKKRTSNKDEWALNYVISQQLPSSNGTATGFKHVSVGTVNAEGIINIAKGYNADEVATAQRQASELEVLKVEGLLPDYNVAHGYVFDRTKAIQSATGSTAIKGSSS